MVATLEASRSLLTVGKTARRVRCSDVLSVAVITSASEISSRHLEMSERSIPAIGFDHIGNDFEGQLKS